MNVVTRRRMTVDEFLAWEDRQETKHEFDGIGPVAMVGISVNHSGINVNLLAALKTRLRGKPCAAFGPELRFRIGDVIRYPDAMVVCPRPRGGQREVSDPVAVFEILSNSTAETDFGAKNREYRSVPSVRRYLILHQTEPTVTMFARHGTDWLGTQHGRDDIIAMPEIGIDLPIAELYEDITFEPEED